MRSEAPRDPVLSPPDSPPPLNPVALKLGHAGLIPFVLGAALVWLTSQDPESQYYAALGLSAYAGLIVSFLGGIHWGLAFRQPVPSPLPFAWGVVPSLLGWVGIVMPPYAGLVVLGAALVACYLVDRKLYPEQGMGRWLTLRFRLTAIASLCCFLGAAGV
ncbi:DUF3429 domain-containing protein [Caldimonas tepidiphila]|uniref:DUF3429 domain-containing protein n=1 Tax=Caldimonas tepidiphila TaxID=2315841 RepID=UPI000E5A3324|nr:DUF3429 domain-containing protein [Caldimonas tepidiphila]